MTGGKGYFRFCLHAIHAQGEFTTFPWLPYAWRLVFGYDHLGPFPLFMAALGMALCVADLSLERTISPVYSCGMAALGMADLLLERAVSRVYSYRIHGCPRHGELERTIPPVYGCPMHG